MFKSNGIFWMEKNEKKHTFHVLQTEYDVV